LEATTIYDSNGKNVYKNLVALDFNPNPTDSITDDTNNIDNTTDTTNNANMIAQLTTDLKTAIAYAAVNNTLYPVSNGAYYSI
jgi:hypothetical protein